MIVKSPQPKAKKTEKIEKGIGYVNGEPFINYWPSDRKPMNLANVKRQTVLEAAQWCKKDGVFHETF